MDDAAAVLAHDGHAHKVAQPHVDAVVRLVLLLNASEFEGVGLRTLHLTRRLQLAHERGKLICVAPILQHLYLANQLDLDAYMLELATAGHLQINLWSRTRASESE